MSMKISGIAPDRGIEPLKKKEITYAKTYQARESFILQIVKLVAARYVYACEV